MKLALSYFYKIRFFDPTMVPLSTAVWDPKWYHNFLKQDNVFIDKRDVINGLRFELFKPGKDCDDKCRGREFVGTICNGDPNTCKFLQTYKKQIYSLNFNNVMNILKETEEEMQSMFLNRVEITFVFMFHEKPNNPCSERWIVKSWFKEHDIELIEI